MQKYVFGAKPEDKQLPTRWDNPNPHIPTPRRRVRRDWPYLSQDVVLRLYLVVCLLSSMPAICRTSPQGSYSASCIASGFGH
jgi:hypothetical protein